MICITCNLEKLGGRKRLATKCSAEHSHVTFGGKRVLHVHGRLGGDRRRGGEQSACKRSKAGAYAAHAICRGAQTLDLEGAGA
jgi:hypothetical protein